MCPERKIDLGTIRVPTNILSSPDQETLEEIRSLEIEQARTLLKGQQQDIAARQKYARNIFWMIIVWLIAIYVLVIMEGLNIINLADSVLITFISGTTINVIALLGFVVKYLFSSPSNKKIRKSKNITHW